MFYNGLQGPWWALFIGRMNLNTDPFGIVPIVKPVITGMGYELWGLECQAGIRSAKVRVYIDGANGITLEDCSQVSEQISAVLDVEDLIHMPYTLEISSPGINRSLFTVEQIQAAVGRKIRVKTSWPLEGRKNFSGILERVGEMGLEIRVQENASCTVPLNAVRNAKLDEEIQFQN